MHVVNRSVAVLCILGGMIFSTPKDEWLHMVWTEQSLTPQLVELYNEHVREEPPIVLRAEPRVFRGIGTNVEQWRSLVAVHFPPEAVDMALRIMACESGGNPNAKNPRSTASGLFQHVRSWWSGSSGYPAFDPFDPESSVKAAAYLYSRNGWSDWRASQHCWG